MVSIVSTMTKVFDVLLAGGGAKSIHVQDMAADLAEVKFEFLGPRPTCCNLICLYRHSFINLCSSSAFRCTLRWWSDISVLESIALVINPCIAIINEADLPIAQRFMVDSSP